MKTVPDSKYILVFLLVFTILVLNTSCSQKGFISEKFSSELYTVPKLLPDTIFDKNPKFIVYGDMNPARRGREKFLRRKNWYTWKMFIFPFYELYLLGNGILGGIDYLRHESNFGFEERIMVRDAVYKEAKNIPADFILMAGDFVKDGRYPDHWMQFIKENKLECPLLSEIPYFPTIGSHEYANDSTYGLKNYQAVFQYPRFYVIESPDVDIFVIDSHLILDHKQFIDDDTQDRLFEKWFVSEEGSEKPSWLEEKLAASNKTFKIISMHTPPVSFNVHQSDWDESDWGRNLPKKRKRLLELFQKHGVQIIFSGHEHVFERNILKYKNHESDNEEEIQIIITGGGGSPIRDITDPEKMQDYLDHFKNEGLNITHVRQDGIHHYCVVEIDSQKIKIDVMEVRKNTQEKIRLEEIIVTEKK